MADTRHKSTKSWDFRYSDPEFVADEVTKFKAHVTEQLEKQKKEINAKSHQIKQLKAQVEEKNVKIEQIEIKNCHLVIDLQENMRQMRLRLDDLENIVQSKSSSLSLSKDARPKTPVLNQLSRKTSPAESSKSIADQMDAQNASVHSSPGLSQNLPQISTSRQSIVQAFA